jgi:hypothetical protein
LARRFTLWLAPIALYRVVKYRRNYDGASLVLYMTSVLFFAPLFLSADPMIAVSSWAAAHGLQYLVFLVFHAGSRTRPTLAGLLPIASPIAVGYVGYLLWNTYPQWANEPLARIGAATVVAINLAHYWVDMFLWHLPERRRWLTEHHAFLVGSPKPMPAE